jgi:hypothetical protein
MSYLPSPENVVARRDPAAFDPVTIVPELCIS